MKTVFEKFTITSVFKGNKKAVWSNGTENRNNHVITILNNDSGQKTRFDFWASIARPQIETERDLLSAFECFVNDAMAGSDTFENFCGDLGYDTDSIRVHKTYKACVRAYEKANRVLDTDLYELHSRLSELA